MGGEVTVGLWPGLAEGEGGSDLSGPFATSFQRAGTFCESQTSN